MAVTGGVVLKVGGVPNAGAGVDPNAGAGVEPNAGAGVLPNAGAGLPKPPVEGAPYVDPLPIDCDPLLNPPLLLPPNPPPIPLLIGG